MLVSVEEKTQEWDLSNLLWQQNRRREYPDHRIWFWSRNCRDCVVCRRDWMFHLRCRQYRCPDRCQEWNEFDRSQHLDRLHEYRPWWCTLLRLEDSDWFHCLRCGICLGRQWARLSRWMENYSLEYHHSWHWRGIDRLHLVCKWPCTFHPCYRRFSMEPEDLRDSKESTDEFCSIGTWRWAELYLDQHIRMFETSFARVNTEVGLQWCRNTITNTRTIDNDFVRFEMRKNLNVEWAKNGESCHRSSCTVNGETVPLTNRLIAPVDIDSMGSFDLWSEFSHVDTVAARSNTGRLTTT